MRRPLAKSPPDRPVFVGVPFRGEVKPLRGMGCNPMGTVQAAAGQILGRLVEAARMAAGPGGAKRRLIYLKNTSRQNGLSHD